LLKVLYFLFLGFAFAAVKEGDNDAAKKINSNNYVEQILAFY
jgi:hypothetical protein